MTTQGQAEPPKHSVNVVGVEEWKGKPTIKVTPWWTSNFPLVIYLKEEEAYIADEVRRGDTITVQKGKLNKGDPKFDSSYYWNIVLRNAPPEPIQQTSQAAGAAPPASQPPATKQTSQPTSSAATGGASNAPPVPKLDVKQWRTTQELNRVDAVNSAIAYTAKNGDCSLREMLRLADTIFEYLESRQMPGSKSGAPEEEQELPF